jgi:hypothetical protein
MRGKPWRIGTTERGSANEDNMASPPDRIAFLSPLVVAMATTFCTILVHALALAAIIHFVRHERRLGHVGVRFFTNVAIVAGAILIALAAHLLEMTAWALVFVLCGEFPHLAAAFYHSAASYTSLGGDDVVMSASWRLLGPLETADGMLMFGVSTATIFAVIQRLVQTRFGESPN